MRKNCKSKKQIILLQEHIVEITVVMFLFDLLKILTFGRNATVRLDVRFNKQTMDIDQFGKKLLF